MLNTVLCKTDASAGMCQIPSHEFSVSDSTMTALKTWNTFCISVIFRNGVCCTGIMTLPK